MEKEIKAKVSTSLFLLVVTVLLVFFNRFGYLDQPKNFVIYLSSPVLSTFQVLSNKVSDFLYIVESIGNLKEENIKLRKENLRLRYEVSRLKEVERENKVLRKQADFSQKVCSKGMCIDWKEARVISRDPSNYGKYIVINLGRKEGIKENQAVVMAGGILIGKVAEVFDSFSKVMLITSPESSVSSITQTTRADGVVRGEYAVGARLEMVEQSEKLIEGDLVITSGLEEAVPKGLVIGRISNVEEAANKVFKQADLDLLADFDHIEEVFIAYQND